MERPRDLHSSGCWLPRRSALGLLWQVLVLFPLLAGISNAHATPLSAGGPKGVQLSVPPARIKSDSRQPGPIQLLVIDGHIVSGLTTISIRDDGAYAFGHLWLKKESGRVARDTIHVPQVLREQYMALQHIRESHESGVPLSHAVDRFYAELNAALQAAGQVYLSAQASGQQAGARSRALAYLRGSGMKLSDTVVESASISDCGGIQLTFYGLGRYGPPCVSNAATERPSSRPKEQIHAAVTAEVNYIQTMMTLGQPIVIIYGNGVRSAYVGREAGANAAQEVLRAAGLVEDLSMHNDSPLVHREHLDLIRARRGSK